MSPKHHAAQQIGRLTRDGPVHPSPTTLVRVLVVDDDELDFLAVKRLLRGLQGSFVFEAIHATSIDESVAALKSGHFDIAVVDYFLGPTCGLDLVERIGGRNGAVPIIMLTGSRDPKVLGKIIDAGITNYLSKDALDGEHLRSLLVDAIDQHRTDIEMLETSGILIDKSLQIPGLGYFDYQVGPNVLLWSRESYVIWGVAPGEFTPTVANVRALVHPDDRVLMREALSLESATGTVELRVLIKGGGERRIHAIVNRVAGPDGKALRLHGIYHDVTAHRLAEGKLRSQERKYQQIFDNSDVSLWLVDCGEIFAAVQQQLRLGREIGHIDEESRFSKDLVSLFNVTDSNKAAVNMFGFEAKTVIQRSAFSPKWLVGLVHDLARGISQNSNAVRSECIIETRSGERSAVFSLPVPRTIDEASSIPVTIIDLTDIHDAELANRANIAKSAFLAHMSHELRSPLNGIVANIDLLRGTSLDDEQESLVSSAQSSAETLLHVIGDILDFSKIEAGRIELERIDVDIQDVILNIDSIVQSKAAVDGVSFSWRIEGTVPQRMEGDPLRLKQVLLNLIANAIRHTSVGGVYLRVSAREAEQGRCVLRFDVIDSGAGLDPLASTHIFQAFVQADGSSARTHGGTGLGLAIAKSIVDLWDGEIGFGGIVGEGAHFWFTMPGRVIQPAAAATAAEAREAMTAANIAVRALVLRSADRTDDSVERYLNTWTTFCSSVTAREAALKLCDDQAGRGQPIAFCSVEEPLSGSWPSETAAEFLTRNVMPTLHLASDSVRSIQCGLRAGFTAFFPPEIDHSTELRNVVLTLRHVQVKGERALRRWGPAESAARGRLWQLRHELRVLILEDQPMNQLVIERQMARLGLRHDVVENGLLALKRMEDTEYSVILCDCSMPKMDGYEFARTVRRREAAAGTRRVPIIALTANVFVEDVERCKAAGMDDFIAKPVDLERISASILTWVGLSGTCGVKFAEPAPLSPTTTLDTRILPAALGTSDPAMLAETYRLFLSESKKHGEAMAACALLRIGADLKQIAHGAKGDARNAGAAVLADLLQALEQAATSNDWQRVGVLVTEIAAEQVKVADFIESHILSGAPTVCETAIGSSIANGPAGDCSRAARPG